VLVSGGRNRRGYTKRSALNLLSRESMKTFQELADEAFRDLLQKYGRPTDLKAALRLSARPHHGPRTSNKLVERFNRPNGRE
jgi:hypothetical protein